MEKIETGIADIAKIRAILKQSSIKELAAGTNIKQSTLISLKSGQRRLEKLNLAYAIELTEYANRSQKSINPIIEIWGTNS
ncbi:hypothetical protein ACNZ61_002138 [Enterococcus hirae]